MKKQDYLDLANAQTKADFIIQELAKYSENKFYSIGRSKAYSCSSICAEFSR